MKRRKALKHIGFGLSAGLTLPQLLASCSKNDPGPEVPFDGNVVVIGAGAAGLYAADILNAKGIKVTVLEAGAQMGGRIRSLRNQTELINISAADFPVELGAEVVYGTDSIWGTNLKNFKVNVNELDGIATDQYIMDSIAKTFAEWEVDGDFTTAQNFVNSLPNYSGGNVSVAQAAGVAARAANLINSQVGNRFGSNSELVGASGVAESLKLIAHDQKPFVLKTNPMQDFLVFRFDQVRNLVQLNTPVSSINYSSDPIVITDANGGQLEASKVIVTVPLAILKSGNIAFAPALPASFTGAMGKFGMDHSIRVVIDFKKNFWGDSTGHIWGGENFPDCFSSGLGRSEFNQTLSITINGPKAAALSTQGQDMVTTILNELDTIYDGQATQFVRRDLNTNQVLSIIQDWGKEEYIQGGISYPLVGATQADRESLTQVIGDKLFFAGEATDISGNSGTINGALASAERVAEQVVKSIVEA